jgi:N-acetylglutamate synthase-like GNAT family acetyltransferase
MNIEVSKTNDLENIMDYIEYKELDRKDIKQNLLENFDRYQEIKQFYKNENGKWVLKEHEFIGNWDKNRYEEVNNFIKNTINKNGYVFGAYDNRKLIGFAVLLNETFGSKNQYIELKFIHVSNKYRHKGIGKILFNHCIKKAKEIGIEKIYISTNTAEESQRFYLKIGCIDAMEINTKLAEKEPYDRQMEYIVE